LFCTQAIGDVIDKNSPYTYDSSKSLHVSNVVPTLGFLCLLLDNKEDLEGQFSQAHYYSLGWSCLPSFIETSQVILLPGRLEENCGHT